MKTIRCIDLVPAAGMAMRCCVLAVALSSASHAQPGSGFSVQFPQPDQRPRVNPPGLSGLPGTTATNPWSNRQPYALPDLNADLAVAVPSVSHGPGITIPTGRPSSRQPVQLSGVNDGLRVQIPGSSSGPITAPGRKSGMHAGAATIRNPKASRNVTMDPLPVFAIQNPEKPRTATTDPLPAGIRAARVQPVTTVKTKYIGETEKNKKK